MAWTPHDPTNQVSTWNEAAWEHVNAGIVEAMETGGGDGLTVVGGGTVNLPAGEVGDLAGYRVTATTTFTGVGGQVILQPGAYIFEYTSSGWRYRTLVEGTALTPPDPGSDTTPPTPGTLASSAVTTTSFTLTVSGASDNVALHSTPYAFSIDNGSTWSTWQSSPTYNATGTPDTTYTCVHRVRDAATPTPNVATGTSLAVTTDAPTVLAADTFTRANTGSNGGISGTTETGSFAWTNPTTSKLQIYNNVVKATTNSGAREIAVAAIGQADCIVSCAMDFTGASFNSGLTLRYVDTSNYLYVRASSAVGQWQIVENVSGSDTTLATATGPATGPHTVSVTLDGPDVTLFVDDVQVATATTTLTTGTAHGFWCYAGGGNETGDTTWDDFEVSA